MTFPLLTNYFDVITYALPGCSSSNSDSEKTTRKTFVFHNTKMLTIISLLRISMYSEPVSYSHRAIGTLVF